MRLFNNEPHLVEKIYGGDDQAFSSLYENTGTGSMVTSLPSVLKKDLATAGCISLMTVMPIWMICIRIP